MSVSRDGAVLPVQTLRPAIVHLVHLGIARMHRKTLIGSPRIMPRRGRRSLIGAKKLFSLVEGEGTRRFLEAFLLSFLSV